MRIRKLILSNYRQFVKEEIDFPRNEPADLNVLTGENGTGKTNILNAINWCLYGDEPHLSRDSQQLPIVNLKTIEKAENGKLAKVIVELHTEFANNNLLRFRRESSYNIYKDNMPVHKGTNFKLHDYSNERGNTNIYTGEEAISFLDRIVPKRIREFFFFDGERLDQYFRESTAQNIRHAVFRLSKLDLLENEIERKLDSLINTLEREAGKLSPEIEKINQKREKEKANFAEIERRIKEAEKQATTAKLKIKEYESKLRDLPDVEKLEEERKRLGKEKKKKEERCEEKIHEKNRILLMRSKHIIFYPVIKKAIRIIKEKEKSGEIPPIIDQRLLHEILEENLCKICGQELNENANQKVRNMIKKIGLSSIVANRLGRMKAPLNQLRRDAAELEPDILRVTKDIQDYQEDINNLAARIASIDNELSTYPKQKIKEWHHEREKFEQIHEQKQRGLGILYDEQKKAKDEISQLEDEFYKEVEKEEKANDIKRQREFCVKALDVARKTREDIMRETRQEIETETEKIFFGLTWKGETFKEVKIKQNYDISLIHSMGFECLGSLSAGERELLALSFFLALHRVSGFQPPILIDTPVARISGEHRVNFAETLVKVSRGKQTILLFTPAEYSQEIAQTLDNEARNRFRLNLSSDEKYSKLEEL